MKQKKTSENISKPSGVEISIIIFIIVFFYWDFIPNIIDNLRYIGGSYTYYIPLILSYIVTISSIVTLFIALACFIFVDNSFKYYKIYKSFLKYFVFYLTIGFFVFTVSSYLFDWLARNIPHHPYIFAALFLFLFVILVIILIFVNKSRRSNHE